jgi:hypothetical protein
MQSGDNSFDGDDSESMLGVRVQPRRSSHGASSRRKEVGKINRGTGELLRKGEFGGEDL